MAELVKHSALPLPVFTKPVKLLLVVSPYYGDIAADLIMGAKAKIDQSGAQFEQVEVPGALEIPTAIGIAERLSKYDGYVAVGCVIRGETTHYETVCNESSRALSMLGLQGLCIGNGILTVENMAQAQARADPTRQNKGGGAAVAALHLIALSRKWGAQRKGIGFRPASNDIKSASGSSTV